MEFLIILLVLAVLIFMVHAWRATLIVLGIMAALITSAMMLKEPSRTAEHKKCELVKNIQGLWQCQH